MSAALISRPEVERRLRAAVEHTPLTLLSAPLGAGKTSAAKMAFRDTPGVVWIEALPWHREAFIRAFVGAVRDARADFGRMTLGALDAGANAAHIGGVFASELARVDEPLTLIVDNVHVFTGEPAFSRFVDAAMNALPVGARILAMGRSLPDVTMVRSFARGKAQILSGDMLTFSAEEIRALGRQFGREIDNGSVAEIEKSTEGWAAGVTLAVAAQRMPLPTAKGPRDAAEVYLTTELLAYLDRSVVAFLERVSVFETLDVAVLNEMDAFAGAKTFLKNLRRSGALISETGPGRYRLNPVLRDLAEARLQKRGAVGPAHRDAAEAYIQAGEFSAALFHADESGDAAIAASLLRNHAPAAIATGGRARVRSLMKRIEADGPDAGVRWYTEGLLEKASASAAARAMFSRAIEAADRSKDAAIAFHARAQAVEHDLGHLIPVASSVLDDLSLRAAPLSDSAVATTLVLQGWAKAVLHDFGGALAAVASLSDTDDASERFNAGILRAYAHSALGQADIAEEILDELMELFENDDKIVLETLTLVWFARLALVWGSTTAASDAAFQAERLASALDVRAEEAALYVALAEVATHHADVEAAVLFAERARARADQAWYAGDVSRVNAFAEIALARAAFLGHDNAIARDLANRVGARTDFPSVQRAVALAESAVYTLLCDPNAAPRTTARAREALASAVPTDAADAAALATADDVLAFLDAANGTPHMTSLNGCEPFSALIRHRRGLVTLEHAGIAVGNARRGRAESSVPFDRAIEALTRNGPRFEARLARAYAASFLKPRRVAQPAAPHLDLTPREREILALLVDGLTNKEIAQRLIVSHRTVETHVERVLGKLEVGSRSRAIAKAIRLGLVSLENAPS